MRRGATTIEDTLRYWEPDPARIRKQDPPTHTRETDEGWEALWVYGEKDEEGENHPAWIARVIITPAAFIYEQYVDVMQRYSDDAVYDEEGNFIGVYDISYEYDEPTAVFTEWETEWYHEHVSFGRKEFLVFLSQWLSGRLQKMERKEPVPHAVGRFWTMPAWERSAGAPAKRVRPPRDRVELAQWVRDAADSAICNGTPGAEEEQVDWLGFDLDFEWK